MTNFGWSYPAGAANDPYAPYNQTDEPIDLTEDRTLKGYGRRGHGMNGKDADLNYGGQNVVESAFWFEDGHIEIEGYRYASLVPDEEWTEAQTAAAQEMVGWLSYPGDWDGDYWVMNDQYRLTVDCPWNDEETEEQNIKRACRSAYDAINANSKNFEQELTDVSKAFDRLSQQP